MPALPICAKPPLPEITPGKLTVSLRLKARVPRCRRHCRECCQCCPGAAIAELLQRPAALIVVPAGVGVGSGQHQGAEITSFTSCVLPCSTEAMVAVMPAPAAVPSPTRTIVAPNPATVSTSVIGSQVRV